jgi:ATP-dependent DNA helicase DinG
MRAAVGEVYKVFVQGEAPVRQLVAAFAADTSSILIGTKSLWAGVDVPGEALSCVVIVKLPFEPPTDPIVAAMGSKSFGKRMLPMAKIALRQGYGRLIRSVDDRGAVVILDRRLLESSYGPGIVAALPNAAQSCSFEAIPEVVGRGMILLPASTEKLLGPHESD